MVSWNVHSTYTKQMKKVGSPWEYVFILALIPGDLTFGTNPGRGTDPGRFQYQAKTRKWG